MEYVVSSNFCSQEQCKSSIAHYENLLAQKSLTENDKIKVEQNRKHLTFWQEHLAFWTDGSVAEYSSYADLRAKYQNGNYILAYYGDRREIKVNISDTIEKVDLKNVYTLTEHPSRELVKYLVNLKTTEAFAQTSGNTQRAAEIKNWFSRFEEILRSIYGDDSLTLDFNIDTFQFTIHQKNREPFDFNTMSMGYAAVFDIIGDLIMRMERIEILCLTGTLYFIAVHIATILKI